MTRVITALAALLLAAALGASASNACGCGMAIEASVPAERALVVANGDGQEQLDISFDILSHGAHGAVVLPVPGRPTVDAAPRSLFSYLAKATEPRVHTVHRPFPKGGIPVGASAPGVKVLSNRRIGAFQVATLGAGSQAGALGTWLTEHHYPLPHGAQPIISSYLKQGWSFVAVRLAKRIDGALTPLRIRFASTRAIYPMRLEQLGTEPVSVDLYVVSNHVTRVPQLNHDFAGRVASLHPAVPAALRSYVTGTWLTHESETNLDPKTLTADFVARRATSDAAYRQVDEEVAYDRPSSSAGGSSSGDSGDRGTSWWVWVIVAVSLFAVLDVAAFVIWRRRRAAR